MNAPDLLSTQGPVLIVGTGLLGCSLGLALSLHGVPVLLSDTSPTSLALARDMGAGEILSEQAGERRSEQEGESTREPRLVVVATPPDVAGMAVVEALERYPQAVVTDVASVKGRVGEYVRSHSPQGAARYVGSHPMAGRERSGAAAADADLFAGRPWVIVPDGSQPEAVLAVRGLAVDVGATPVSLDAHAHDDAVAAVSHVPQLISSLLAAQLRDVPEQALALSGQGLRDVTRIAASDPRLWSAIVTGNAPAIRSILEAFAADLATLIEGLRGQDTPGTERGADPAQEAGAPIAPAGAVGAVSDVMTRGQAGVQRIPGKHGGAPQRYAHVSVLVPDEPGALGRLFADIGHAGVNIEDLSLEHSAHQPVGLAIVAVEPAAADGLEEWLTREGWRVVRQA